MINTKRIFTLKECNQVLPVINMITTKHKNKIDKLINSLSNASETLYKTLEQEIDLEVETWQTKLTKLGIKTNGLYVADFDNGNGYFCWKYPENVIKYEHKYNEGFRGRVEVK